MRDITLRLPGEDSSVQTSSLARVRETDNESLSMPGWEQQGSRRTAISPSALLQNILLALLSKQEKSDETVSDPGAELRSLIQKEISQWFKPRPLEKQVKMKKFSPVVSSDPEDTADA